MDSDLCRTSYRDDMPDRSQTIAVSGVFRRIYFVLYRLDQRIGGGPVSGIENSQKDRTAGSQLFLCRSRVD